MSSTPAFTEDEFRKARASEAGKECVRVARRDGRVEMRDDKKTFGAADDHRLVFTDQQFDDFLAGVRSGDTSSQCLEMTRRADGTYTFRSAVRPAAQARAAELTFTEAEVAAFLDGIQRHEFDRGAYAAVSI